MNERPMDRFQQAERDLEPAHNLRLVARPKWARFAALQVADKVLKTLQNKKWGTQDHRLRTFFQTVKGGAVWMYASFLKAFLLPI